VTPTPMQTWIFGELDRTLGPASEAPTPDVVELESMLSALGAARADGLVDDEELQNHTETVAGASTVTMTWTSRAWLDTHATVSEHLGVVEEEASGAAGHFEVVNGEHAAGLRSSVVLWADGEGQVVSWAVFGILGSGWLADLLRGLVPGAGLRADREMRPDAARAYRVAGGIDAMRGPNSASTRGGSASVGAEVERPYDHRAALARRASVVDRQGLQDLEVVAGALKKLGLGEEDARHLGPAASTMSVDPDLSRVWATTDVATMLRLDGGRALGAEHSGRRARTRDALIAALRMRSFRPLGGAAWSPASSDAGPEPTAGPLRVTLQLDPTGAVVSSWDVSCSLGREGVIDVFEAFRPDEGSERSIAASARLGLI